MQAPLLSDKEQADLATRLGRDLLKKRLEMEGQSVTWSEQDQAYQRKLTKRKMAGWVVANTLKASGLYARALANADRPEVRTNKIALPSLDKEAPGLRILHLSDLHLEAKPDLLARVAPTIAGLAYDLAIITGDLSDTAPGPALRAELQALPELLKCRLGIVAILGNHDSITMVPPLESLGVRFLLNENIIIPYGRGWLGLAGVDDCRHYKTDHLEKSLSFASRPDAVILLSHAPDLADQAAASGVDLYLCGHTHAGQICLAPGQPVFTQTSAPRDRVSGPWRIGTIQGYTSAGLGSSYPPVRLNCRPEITLHHIR